MSIKDAKQLFSSAQSISPNAGAADVSTNTLNLGTLEDKRNSTLQNQIGRTGMMQITAQVEGTAVKAAGAGTLLVKLYTKASASSMTSGTLIATAEAVTTANNSTSNPDGTVLAQFSVPAKGMLQYCALAYEAATQNVTAGQVTAWLGRDVEAGEGE